LSVRERQEFFGIQNLILFSYRDFRESTSPYYYQTSTYWNIIAARLAFIIVFEHIIFFIIYLMQWLVPDVPKTIQNKIDHERYIDQRERWASKTTVDHFKDAAIASEALTKIMKRPNGITSLPTISENGALKRPRSGRALHTVQLSSDNEG
jgi:hypothetical protein